MKIDVDLLLKPIEGDVQTGCNIRGDARSGGLYFELKDARSAARLAERKAEADSEQAGLAPQWRVVHERAIQVLGEISKDIEVAVWLVEASIRLDGFAGLRASLIVLDGLVERYWDGLHALDEADPSTKIAPIAGLNGVGAEGSLIQPMRLAPLTDPADGEAAGLWHYMVMRRRGPAASEAVLLASAVRATSPQRLVEIFQDVSQCLRLYTDLTHRLDRLCQADAPPSSTIRNVLEEAMDAMRDVARDALSSLEKQEERPQDPVAPPPQAIAAAAAQAESPAQPQMLRTREEALRELSRIAAFFQEYEPNSPTAYTLETVIRRARLPLMDLLAELIPEEASRRTYLDIAGIRPTVT